jgi:EmrB/QacA subfamily drug resistance transporter
MMTAGQRKDPAMTSFQRRTVIFTCLATAMLMLDIAVVNVAIPRIGHDLHSGLTGLQWVVDAYTVILAACVLTAGSLADRLGRRFVLQVGVGVFTVASVVCATATNITALDVARGVQGLGAAAMFATSLAVLADAFPERKERNGAFAAYGATIGASFAVGPLLGGVLTAWFGWRSIFFVNVPLGLVCLAGTVRLRESSDPHPRRVDWIGQGLLVSGLFLLVLGLLRGNAVGWSSPQIVVGLVGAVALLAGFIVVERLRRAPMLPLEMFRDPSFTGAQVAAFTMSASFFAIFIYLILYLQEILHLSPIRAGLALMPCTIVVFVVSGVSSQLVDRISHRVMISGGLGLAAVGLAAMTIAGTHSSWTALLVGEIVVGVGTGLFNPAMSNVALSVVPERESGLAAGVNDTFRQMGIAVGIAALGAVIPARDALGAGSAGGYVNGLHTALIIGTIVAAAGSVATMALIGRGATAPSRATADVDALAAEVA